MKHWSRLNRPAPLPLVAALSLVTLLGFDCERASDEATRLQGEASRLLREAEEQSGIAGETRWMTAGGWPVPRFLPRGEAEAPPDVVGYLQKGDSSRWVSIGAFDGRSFATRWVAGPFEVAQQYSQPHEPLLVVSRGHVVASPDRRKVRVFSGADGRELGVFDLGSSVRGICAAPDDAGFVWLDLESTQHKRLNVADGTIEAMDRPGWCPQPGEARPLVDLYRCSRLAGDAACQESLGEERFDIGLSGGASYYLLREGRGVAVGREHSTDRVNTTLVGVDLGERAATWRHRLEEQQVLISNLLPGRFYAVIQHPVQRAQSHLVALDTSNGRELFRVELPWATRPVVGPLLVEGDRIYLPRSGWLDVFDAATGQTLGAVGDTP